MKQRAFYAFAISALATAALAQTPNSSQTTAPNPAVAPNANQTTPARPETPPADPTATTSPTTAPPAQTKQDKSVTADKQAQEGQQQAQQPAQTSPQEHNQASPQQSTPQQNDQQSKLPQSDANSAGVAPLDTGGMTSAELQARIDAALRSEPTLTGDTLTVNVTDDEINVSGTVGSGKERTTASRIVQSFGENRKVKEKINVSGVKK